MSTNPDIKANAANGNATPKTKPDGKPKQTEIAFVLDRSGSMGPVAEAAVAGFNAFLRDQQMGEGHARLTLVLFDHEYLVPACRLPVGDIDELDATTYVPRGSTALLDAVGRTIRTLRKSIKATPPAGRPDNVVLAIFTDGFENASTQFTFDDIAKKITKRREKDGWQFLFLGANQDAIGTAAKMHIAAADAATFQHDATGVQASTRSANRRIHAHRAREASPDRSTPLGDILAEEDGRNGKP